MSSDRRRGLVERSRDGGDETACEGAAGDGRDAFVSPLIAVCLCALFVFVSFVPHRYLPAPKGGVSGVLVGAMRLLPAACAAGSFLLWFLVRRGRLRELLRTSLFPELLALLLIALAGGLGAPNTLFSFSRAIYYSITGGLIYFLSVRAFDTTRRISGFLSLAVTSAALVSLYGIAEFLAGRNPLFHSVFASGNTFYARFALKEYAHRIYATVGHPVFLGAYLAMLLPLAFFLLLNAERTRTRLLAQAGAGVIAVALFLTFSRGAWVACAAALTLYPRRKRWKVCGVPLVFAGLVLAVLLIAGWGRMAEILRTRNPYPQYVEGIRSNSRAMAYRHATEVLAEHPLFGIGTGNYRYLPQRQGYGTPDNMYLRVLVENGIFGLACMILLFHRVLRSLFRCARERGSQGRRGDLAWAFLASFVAFFIDMLTCDALYFPLTRITFWMLAGVAMNSVNRGFLASRG